jgi:hypothetical protein
MSGHEEYLTSSHHCITLVPAAPLDASSDNSLALQVMSKGIVSKDFVGI